MKRNGFLQTHEESSQRGPVSTAIAPLARWLMIQTTLAVGPSPLGRESSAESVPESKSQLPIIPFLRTYLIEFLG
jgi:hypothetical protein